MKNKTFSLVLGIIALIQVVYSFLSSATTGRMLTFELNIWLYRLIWSAITFAFFYDYYKSLNKGKS
ncbi:hypothetical protein [Formosa sp. 4Alg 33]|uniref:hypothetical protein n=1 Tax=Formosa sp. 4Alg 33 TaxID=3382189 RepID=UPI003D9C6464